MSQSIVVHAVQYVTLCYIDPHYLLLLIFYEINLLNGGYLEELLTTATNFFPGLFISAFDNLLHSRIFRGSKLSRNLR